MRSTPMIFADLDALEDALSEPTPGVIETFSRLDGDILFLGAAGKMGPTLARMAKRASEAAGVQRRVCAVSRFADTAVERRMNAWGIETIRADLLEDDALDALPGAPNVVYMAAMKFGATGQEPLTWAMNCWLPAQAARRFRGSRIVAFSTGNVYGLTPVEGGGSVETDTLRPDGEYAMSAMGRERMFQYFSELHGTRVALVRLNYACEPRYGILVDIAQKIWADLPVDCTMGHFNILWQGDANAYSLQAFDIAESPPAILNVTGPEVLRVRDVAERFGALMKKSVVTTGHEAPDALLNNARPCLERFGMPTVSTDALIEAVADWVMKGGATHGKPTKFEVRDGKF